MQNKSVHSNINIILGILLSLYFIPLHITTEHDIKECFTSF